MDVMAPASRPPVQDSAVPSIQPWRMSVSPRRSASPWMVACASCDADRPDCVYAV
ncbi:hypothetical protein [Achromobacter sp. DMS1]|uniref:hypothetical protein n=1 Tax=Achromobacter sp. DMS1 TaxID=1688405 RepID=UPI000B06824C|nr:hypothetical protein [Achromobacter sp. DMS1]